MEKILRGMASKTYKTSYGLEYRLLTPKQWDKEKSNFMDYDRSIADMHIKNSGSVIVDTQYGAPIDNEYDLGEIYGRIDEMKKNNAKSAKLKSAALGGQG